MKNVNITFGIAVTLVAVIMATVLAITAVAVIVKRSRKRDEETFEMSSNGLTEIGNTLTCNSLMQQIAHFAPSCTRRAGNVFMFHDDFNHDTSSLYVMNQFYSRGSGAKWVWKKDGTLESDNTNSDLGLRVNPVILPQNIKSIVVTSEYLGTRDDDFSGILIYDAERSNVWMCGISNDYPNRRSKRRTGTNSGIIRSSSLTNDSYSMVQTGPNKDVTQPHTFRVEYKEGSLNFYVDGDLHSRVSEDIKVTSFGIVSIAQSPPSKWKSLSAVIIHEDGGNRIVLTDPVHVAEKLCIGTTCISQGSLRAMARLGGMLDGFPTGGGVGYSVYRLYGSYDGPVLQVTNSNTGGNTDIYTNGKGDVVALSAGVSTLSEWLGDARAFVRKWYNQGSAQNVRALSPRGGSRAYLALNGNRITGVRFGSNGYYTSNLYNRGYLDNNHGGDMSMEAMFYPTSSRGTQYITGDNNQNEGQIIFRNGRITAVYAPWGRTTLNHSMDTPLNTWYYVAFTHSRDNTFKLYVNGSLVQSTRSTYRTSHRYYGPEGRIRVGQQFRGILGTVTAFDSVMNAEEIRLRYTQGFVHARGTGDVEEFNGDVNIMGHANVQNRLHFRDPTMNDKPNFSDNNSDPYFIEKKIHGRNDSTLDLTINDDADEKFRILGNSCGEGPSGCYGPGVVQHVFQANGDAFHKGNLTASNVCVDGNCLNSGNISRIKELSNEDGMMSSDFVTAKKIGGYRSWRDQIIILCKYGAHNDRQQNVIGTMYHNRTTGWNTGIIMNVVYSQSRSGSGGHHNRYTAALNWMGGNRGGVTASMVRFDWNGSTWVGVRIQPRSRYWSGNHYFSGYNTYRGSHQFRQINTSSASNVRKLRVEPFESQGSIKTSDKLCINNTCIDENSLRSLISLKNEAVKYSDDIVISADVNHGKHGGNTPNCGWYGCRVAHMQPQNRTMKFGHGGSNPQKFWIRKHPSNT